MQNVSELLETMKFIGERPTLMVGSVDVSHGAIWAITGMILSRTRQVPFGQGYTEACQVLRQITDPNIEHCHMILLGDVPPGSDEMLTYTRFGERVAKLVELLERTELSRNHCQKPS